MSDILAQLAQQDLSDVPHERGVLGNGLFEVEVTGAETKENKDKTGHNFNFVLSTTETYQSHDGKQTIAPGHKLFLTISLVETEKYNPLERLAAFAMATRGEKEGAFGSPEDYIGQTLVVKGQFKDDEYGKGTNIVQLITKEA